MNDDFYDKCFDAWVSGENSDNVSADEYDRLRSRGFYPEEISFRELLPKPDKEIS